MSWVSLERLRCMGFVCGKGVCVFGLVFVFGGGV